MDLRSMIRDEKRIKTEQLSPEEELRLKTETIAILIKENAATWYENMVKPAIAKQLAEDPANTVLDVPVYNHPGAMHPLCGTNGVDIPYPTCVGIKDLVHEDDMVTEGITYVMAKFFVLKTNCYAKTHYYDIFFNQLIKSAQTDDVDVSELRLKRYSYQIQKLTGGIGKPAKIRNYKFDGYYPLEGTKLNPYLPPCLIYNYKNMVKFECVWTFTYRG